MTTLKCPCGKVHQAAHLRPERLRAAMFRWAEVAEQQMQISRRLLATNTGTDPFARERPQGWLVPAGWSRPRPDSPATLPAELRPAATTVWARGHRWV